MNRFVQIGSGKQSMVFLNLVSIDGRSAASLSCTMKKYSTRAKVSPIPEDPSKIPMPVHTKTMNWEELSGEEKARLFAFTQRMGLRFENKPRLLAALSHKSFMQGNSSNETAERFQYLGEKVINLYISEFFYVKYPKLPSQALAGVVESQTSLNTLADIAKTCGIHLVMRWIPHSVNENGKTGEATVAARIVQSLVGAIYAENGISAAREFVKNHFISRRINITAHLNLSKPKHTLLKITEELGQKRPVARLLKETGASSRHPVYLVGMFSGSNKIGEGYGDSKAMAEERSAKDALVKYYLKEVDVLTLPSDADDSQLSFFDEQEN